MERGEGRPAGFQYSPEVKREVKAAFGIKEGKRSQLDHDKEYRLVRAERFLTAVENRAVMDMLTPKGSVDVVLTAPDQPTKADVTKAVNVLAQKATAAGLVIDEEASERNLGSISGKIKLADAPQLAINMFRDQNPHALELQRPRSNR